jgi:NAD+ kinase
VRVLIVPNNDNASAIDAAGRLAAWLTANGHEPVLFEADAKAAGLERHVSRGDMADVSLVVALGGDGTILAAVHALDGVEVPILGVHLGRLGFLSGAEADEMTEAVAQALAGSARIERLVQLEATVEGPDGTIGTFRGLNEAFVGREATARVVEVSLAVNGRELQRFMCDGVIVATPAGSTAYSLSVGGPIVSPAVRGLVLVPVGAHTLAQRAFVLGPDDVVEVTFPNAVRASACVTLDGMHPVCAAPLERVTVRLSDAAVPLVRLRDRDFYDVVRRKFLGG